MYLFHFQCSIMSSRSVLTMDYISGTKITTL